MIAVLILILTVSKVSGQCPAGSTIDTTGACLPGLGCPSGTCVGTGCTDPAGTCTCCTAGVGVGSTCPTGTTTQGPCLGGICQGTQTCVGSGCGNPSGTDCNCCSMDSSFTTMATTFGFTLSTNPSIGSTSCAGRKL